MYRYELHMHTKEGSACAVSLVEDMIKQYVKIGFSGAVVTNHFIRGNTCISRSLPWEQLIMQYSKAYTNGRKIAEELDFDLFFGIEEGYGNGKEFLAYGFEPEFLLSRPFLRNADLNIWAQEIHSVGGFIAYAHPFRDRDYITNPDEVPDISIVDGIEGYNRGNRDIENEKAIRVFGNANTIITAPARWPLRRMARQRRVTALWRDTSSLSRTMSRRWNTATSLRYRRFPVSATLACSSV